MPNNRTWGEFMKRILFAMLGIAALSAHGALAQSSVDTLAKIKQAKAINVAFSPDSLPFSISEANGEPAGYTIDLCKRAIAQIGRAVGEGNLKVNWIAGSVSERLQMVAAGRADLECANTTPTQSRLATVDFSNLIFVDSGGLLVKTGTPINATSDLTGKRVAVLKGTTTETRLNEALRRRLINASVVTIANATEGIAMLESGSADAYAGDKIKLVGLMATAKDPRQFALLAEDLSFEPYALALPRGDSKLRLEVNKALTQIYTSPDIEAIFTQWMGRIGRPSPMLAAMYLLNSIPE
jgi:ABC-type amino acid transport substrate-binding protein